MGAFSSMLEALVIPSHVRVVNTCLRGRLMENHRHGLQLTLYVRSLCPRGAGEQQRAIIDRLQTLADAEAIEGYSVTVWGPQIPCDPQTAAGRSLLDRIETFEAWSERAGTSLSSVFERRTTTSRITGETREAIVPPVFCLAESHDGDLRYVSPCVDAGAVRTVADRLNTIQGDTHEFTEQKAAGD